VRDGRAASPAAKQDACQHNQRRGERWHVQGLIPKRSVEIERARCGISAHGNPMARRSSEMRLTKQPRHNVSFYDRRLAPYELLSSRVSLAHP